jgi:hypothetical protein
MFEGVLLSSDHATEYRSIVGGLQYLAYMRPDISYAVNMSTSFFRHHVTPIGLLSSAFCTIFSLLLLMDCIFILHHLVRSLHSLMQTGLAVQMIGDPRGDMFFYFGPNLIALSARSSTEAEYKAVANATAEIIWVQSLLRELGISQSQPSVLWCDNISATYLSSNPVFHARTMHIKVDYHFVREQVTHKLLQIKFISSKDQLAEIFTKPLSLPQFKGCRRNLNLLNTSGNG